MKFIKLLLFLSLAPHWVMGVDLAALNKLSDTDNLRTISDLRECVKWHREALDVVVGNEPIFISDKEGMTNLGKHIDALRRQRNIYAVDTAKKAAIGTSIFSGLYLLSKIPAVQHCYSLTQPSIASMFNHRYAVPFKYVGAGLGIIVGIGGLLSCAQNFWDYRTCINISCKIKNPK
ncbi:MAG: hypothetical protein WC707_05220 [Candidatus Babeliaceae bacterium]|jgi:hypothetical protein